MTKQELETKLDALVATANGLEGSAQDELLDEIDMLRMQIAGMALAALAAKLNEVQLPKLEEMDDKIRAAEDATAAQADRVAAAKSAISILKTVVGIVL